jgi:CheY-like chemotaxis protein
MLLMDQGSYSKETVAENLRLVQTAAKDAVEVVRRLREFYRPYDPTETFAPIDLRELVQRVAVLTRPKWQQQTQSKGITIKLETDLREVPLVSGNESEIREVLTNLVFNSVDAMPNGGEITLSSYSQDGYVVFSVTDTGTGMSEEVRQRCLDPFFSTKGEKGTGLGLSMVYGIVQRHNGTVQIDSKLGIGTNITIFLPTQVRQDGKAVPTEVAAPAAPLHVLAVDDQPVALQVVERYLTFDGHTVETAADGRQALEKLRAGGFDLVITDRAMPGMNGDQLAAIIKEMTPGMPIILLTGFGDMIQAQGEEIVNVTTIVSKPVTITDLRGAVERATDKDGMTG